MTLWELTNSKSLDTKLSVVPGRHMRGKLRTADAAWKNWFKRVKSCTLKELLRDAETPHLDWSRGDDGTIRGVSKRFIWWDDAMRIVEYLRVTMEE